MYSINTTMEHTLRTRVKLTELLASIPVEKADVIPPGWRNNARWHAGHLLVVPRRLTLRLLGDPLVIPPEYVEWFGKGTSPDTWGDRQQLPSFRKLVQDLLPSTEHLFASLGDRFESRYEEPYPTSVGIALGTPAEALGFSLIHDSIHIGLIRPETRLGMMSAWIDISIPVENDMLRWPGDDPVKVERVLNIAEGDLCNLSRLCFGTHTGTHVDAPLHFLRDGEPIDRMPLSVAQGKARVIEVRNRKCLSREDLEKHRIRKGERILLKTDNSRHPWHRRPFAWDYAHVGVEGATYLASRDIRMVGIDYLAVSPPREQIAEVHRLLLEAGIWIIEGLDLSNVQAGRYDLVCLPLRIAGADGAPARAIVRPAG